MLKENPTTSLLPSLLESQQWFTADSWKKINHKLLAKMIREFHYEGLITAQKGPEGLYEFQAKEGVHYRFQARVSLLEELLIDENSIERSGPSHLPSTYALTPMQMILDLYEKLEMKEFTTTYFVEELLRTLLSDLHLLKGV